MHNNHHGKSASTAESLNKPMNNKRESIKLKGGHGMSTVLLDHTGTVWEREEAFRENERTVKRLMVEVARL
jgi:hypothetical protein